MEHVGGGQVGQLRRQRAAHERPVREDQRGLGRGDVRPEQQQRERRRRRERGEDREPLAGAAPADAGREAGTDRDVDQQPDQGHRGGQVGRDGLPGVAEADRLAAEPRLEPDEQDGHERRPQDRRAIAVVAQGQDRHPEDLEADDHRHAAMDPLDPGLGVVERRQDLVVAERPVGAAEPGFGGAHDDADRDQRERGQEGRQGKALEAGHEVAILSPRAGGPARAALGRRPRRRARHG